MQSLLDPPFHSSTASLLEHVSAAHALDPSECYSAMQAHDRRFDGRFFVGVSSTGIYCRPICRVRLPKLANCSFYPSSAAAEGAGFRPCMKCRPELAPGFATSEQSAELASAAARLLDASIGSDALFSMQALAAKVGVSARHLQRLFVAHVGATPKQYQQTRRLLIAKQLLTETRLSVSQVALSSGFASERRMAASLAKFYRLSATQLRASRVGAVPSADSLELRLDYRPPLDFAALLAFFAARAIPGVDEIGADYYARTVRIQGLVGWICVRQDATKSALLVRVSESLVPGLAHLLRLVRRVFDLDCEPVVIQHALAELKPPAGLRLPGAFDGFELATRAVLGQQVTVAAARTLAARLVQRFGDAHEPPEWTQARTLTRTFPRPEVLATLAVEQIAELGIIRTRAAAIITIAKAVCAGDLVLTPIAQGGFNPMALITALQKIPGIGAWTAHYLAMRALSAPDLFLPGDVALQNALGLGRTAADVALAMKYAQRFAPWRSYAVLQLWALLNAGQTLRVG
jgi:AraC family transcriptional regulator, regulatory protein of adaptative response / DNA-3-methyladenine glycosylase II